MFPHMLSPITLGGVTLPNRVLMGSMHTGLEELGDPARVARFPRAKPFLEVLEDRRVLATFLVDTVADSGPGSLRQAILDANSAAGADTIQFAVGTGAQTITPLSALPTVSGAVTIDAGAAAKVRQALNVGFHSLRSGRSLNP